MNYDATAPDFAELSLVSGEPFLQDGVESAVCVFVTDDLDNAPAVQLSLNDGVWTDVARNDDGSYVFNLTGGIEGFTLRAIDHAENETVLSVSAPADPVATADILTVTNQDVTVSAAFSADSVSKQYSLDGGETWLDYGDGVVLTENGTVNFRAANILGYSGVATLTVDQDVTVTATFSEDSALRQYSFNGKNWYDYTDGVVFEKNGSVQFRATDAAGNESAIVTYTVDNILINGPDKHKNDSLFGEDGKTGVFSKVSLGFAISQTSEHQKESAMLINYLLNDPEGATIMASERGIPESKAAYEVLEAAGLLDPVIAEAHGKVMEASEYPEVPVYESNDLKGSEGTYPYVFGGLSYGEFDTAEGAQELYDGMLAACEG